MIGGSVGLSNLVRGAIDLSEETPKSPFADGGGPTGPSTDDSADAAAPVDLDAVEDVIEIIRPAIQADGGDIELKGVDDSGVVTVELQGACVSCPASTVTMKAGIERIMKDRVPGVTAVVQPDDEDFEVGTAVSL